MRLIERIRDRKEMKQQVDGAIDAGNKAFSEAFARALRMDQLQVESGTKLGMGKLNAKFDTGFRLERVLDVTSYVHRHRLYRFIRAKRDKGNSE